MNFRAYSGIVKITYLFSHNQLKSKSETSCYCSGRKFNLSAYCHSQEECHQRYVQAPGGSYPPLKHHGGCAAVGSIVQTGYLRDGHCLSLHVFIRTSGLGHEHLQQGYSSLCSQSSPLLTVLSENMVLVPSNHTTIHLHPLPSLLKSFPWFSLRHFSVSPNKTHTHTPFLDTFIIFSVRLNFYKT